jgi:hypothetical protein
MKVILALIATVFIWVLALIPTWIFLGVKSFANPEGFWQNIVLLGVGVWVLGGIQMVFVIGGLAVSFSVWFYMFN